MNCLNCSKETNNPKYCSRSCSATVTGRTHPKRKSKRTCSQCNKIVKSYRHTRCEEHWNEYKETKYLNKTLEEYYTLGSVKYKHPSWKAAHIRALNRKWNKELLKLPCSKCGYNKHVELCHIKAISSFSIQTKLLEVNAKENIIQLCRNCHWEMDHPTLCSVEL